MATRESTSDDEGVTPVTSDLSDRHSINVFDPLLPPEQTENLEHQEGFGNKTIGPFGSVVLLFNNLSGPGMVGLPLLYQQAGWFLPTLMIAYISICTVLASSMLCEAMRYYPGNRGYKDRIEFSTLCKFYFGHKFYMLTQLILNLSLQSVNIAGIIETAQVMDLAILKIFGRTGGLEFYPHFHWDWATTPGTGITPFGDVYILSLGFITTLLMVIPFGYFNLDDNMIVQKVAFLIACVIFSEWIIDFIIAISTRGINVIPFMGPDQSMVIGTIMFNYAMVVTVPSWCNEKTHSTNVTQVLVSSNIVASVLFLLVGVLGAMAYNIPLGGDILDAINDSPQANLFSQVAVYLFPISVIATSIPIYSIIIRYNLLENKICGKILANFFAVILPWIVVIPFYTGSGLTNVINWSSLIVNGSINFIVPFIIYIKARRRKALLDDEERLKLDMPLDVVDDPTVYCFGRITIQPGETAPPHFALPKYWDDKDWTPIIMAATIAATLSIICVGIIILNIIAAVL